jgi:hypothetical protein
MSHDVVVETILHDDDVLNQLSAADAARWMGEAVDAHHRGELVAPPRVHADFGDGRVVFTAGRLRGSWFGYRSYDTLPADPGAQVVVVHDEATGRVRAVAIGTGTQAYAQVWALAAVRDLREVRVYSRDPTHRASFVERIAPLVAGTCRPAADARAACKGAQIVVLATSSPTPVVDAAWIAPGAYVTTLGPKQQGRAEFGLDLPETASVLVTDSLDQIGAYDPPNVLVGTRHEHGLVSLGAVRAGEVAKPTSEGISLFFSVGVAGTEAFLLDRLTASIENVRQ